MLKISQLISSNLAPKYVENLLALIYAFISQNQKFSNVENDTQLQSPLEKTTELSSMPFFPVENIFKSIRIWVYFYCFSILVYYKFKIDQFMMFYYSYFFILFGFLFYKH